MIVPTLSEILSDTQQNYDAILNNIALMNAQFPTKVEEEMTNTNMLLAIKRYLNQLHDTGILIPADDLQLVLRLVSISDNVTNSAFTRITELLRVTWEIRLVNPNHDLFLVANLDRIFDENKKLEIPCEPNNVFLKIMQHVLDNYGHVDLRMNTKYVASYNISNIVAAIRTGRNISAYIFEKFCKFWNISYSYTISSTEKEGVQVIITMDPSGWI